MLSYFWNGYVLRDFVFQNFNTNTIPGFAGVFVSLFCVGILYEALFYLKQDLLQTFFRLSAKSRRSHLHRVIFSRSDSDEPHVVGGGGDNNLRNSLLADDTPSTSGGPPIWLPSHQDFGLPTPESGYLLVSSILHAVYVFIGFTLMNAAMTFNIWVFVAIISGVGVGFLIFRTGAPLPPRKKASPGSHPFRNAIETDDEADVSFAPVQKTESPTKSTTSRTSHGSGTSRASKRVPGEGTGNGGGQGNNEVDESIEGVSAAQVIIVGAQVHQDYIQSE